MYKVFVNEKKLSLSNHPTDFEKNLKYDDSSTFEIAIDLLENTSCPELNIYADNLEQLWENFKEMFTKIYAAGGIVSNESSEILFIFRLGRWDLPKGKIEIGESLEEAAKREVEEECGLKELKIKQYINTTYHIYTERNGKKTLKVTNWFTMDYFGKDMPIPQIEEGITNASWKAKDVILNDIFPNTFQNIKLILTEIWEKS